MNALHGLSNDEFLHKLPEKDVFIQPIGCFRMRMEDACNFGGNNFGIYGDDSPVPLCKEFLDLAEKRGKLLPSWWNKEKRQECERVADNQSGRYQWADINSTVEKSDIIEHYGDGMMPTKLRILGEKIYGKGFL
jgi:splicing suppressor protein 51